MAFVLDASTTLAWLFEDEATEAAEAIFALTDDTAVHVPVHWYVEVANGAIKGERRRRTTRTQTNEFLGRLAMLDVIVDHEGVVAASGRLVPLARQHDLSVYDTGYLELAERLGLALATNDDALARAARSVGVEVLN